jgi:hypothetical protein
MSNFTSKLKMFNIKDLSNPSQISSYSFENFKDIDVGIIAGNKTGTEEKNYPPNIVSLDISKDGNYLFIGGKYEDKNHKMTLFKISTTSKFIFFLFFYKNIKLNYFIFIFFNNIKLFFSFFLSLL